MDLLFKEHRRMTLQELVANFDPDEDAFASCEYATPAELRQVADDWERMAPIIAGEFIQQRKSQGDELREQLEAAAVAGDENTLRELYKLRACRLLGIVTQREIRSEIAARLSRNEGYTHPMRCALELMI